MVHAHDFGCVNELARKCFHFLAKKHIILAKVVTPSDRAAGLNDVCERRQNNGHTSPIILVYDSSSSTSSSSLSPRLGAKKA
jgi:hypothetical protein